MVYNLTNVTDANNFYEMLFGMNEVSGSLIAVFILVSLFLLIFMVFKKYEQDTKEVLLMDCTITSVIAVLFWAIQLISWKILIYPIIGLFASIMIYKLSD